LIIIMGFYSIVGLHVFKGAAEYRCRVTPEPPADKTATWQIYEDIPYLCGRWQCPQE
jgi:hypothetical protein